MLYLIPCYLGETSSRFIFPEETFQLIQKLQYYIVENEKSARRFIKFIYPEVNQSSLHFETIGKHFSVEDLSQVTQALAEGKDVGLLSEAGTPCIADPGNIVVQWAHQHQISVKPIVGPSSIYLALMASGMNGQNFQFHGYLPIDKKEKIQTLKQMEQESQKANKTQLFMETPYRNNALLEVMMQYLQPNTLLCIATNVTLPNEQIQTKSIAQWKAKLPNINKQPTLFLLQKK